MILSDEMNAMQRLQTLVGRDKELQCIETIFVNLKNPAVYYLEGRGGVGKTTVALALLARLRDQGYVGTDLVDLYHVEHQSQIGLIESIVYSFGRKLFSRFDDEYSKLQRQRASGIEPASEEWLPVWRAFLDDLERLSRKKPLLIVLDTTEALGYEQDRFHRETRRELPEHTVGKWLVDTIILQTRGRVLWLLSGRPADLSLYDHLVQNHVQKAKGLILHPKYTLQPLEQSAAQEYFEAVIENLRQAGRPLEAQRIENTLKQSAEALWQLSEGRPIQLALIADVLSQGGDLPNPSDFERRAHVLLQNLLSLDNPLGSTLRAMAHLPKGTDVELLRRVVKELEGNEISLEEAAENLTRASTLVLVKQYHTLYQEDDADSPERFFLHDELYDLFECYQDAIVAERKQLLPIIEPYYDYQEQASMQELALQPGPERRDILQRRRDVLRVERLYYQLLADFDAGAEQYFLLAEDWMDARQKDAYLMLYTNIHRALRSLHYLDVLQNRQIERVDLNLAVRWGMAKLLFDNDPEGALNLFEEIREWAPFKDAQIEVPKWHLNLYEAVAKIRLGKRIEPKVTLDTLGREIGAKVDEIKRQREVPKSVLLLQALTYHYQGYLHRLGSDYYRAIDLYHKAISLFEQIGANMLISEYEHLINALAQVGYFRRGRQVFYEAVDLAKQQSNPLWEMRLQIVMTGLETLDGRLQEAVDHGIGGLKTLLVVPNPRWQSFMCVTLAKTYRQLWNRSVSLHEWRTRWPQTLKVAYGLLESQGASAIPEIRADLEKRSIPSPAALSWLREQAQQGRDQIYYVDALIEGGCVWRELAWLYRKYQDVAKGRSLQSTGFESEEWREWAPICMGAADQAEIYFLEAAGLSEVSGIWHTTHAQPETIQNVWKRAVKTQIDQLGGGRYWPTLALVNLAWHWRYQGQVSYEVIESLCNLIEALIPASYHLPAPTKKRDRPGTELLLWAVLGKMEMLRFDLCVRFDEWAKKTTLDAADKDELDRRLREATPHVIYSLQYNRLLGDATFDRMRAEDGLAQRLSMVKQHRPFILNKIYTYDQQFVERVVAEVESSQPEYENENEIHAPSELRKWLEERFSGPDIWG